MPRTVARGWDAVLGKKFLVGLLAPELPEQKRAGLGLDASTWTGRCHLLIPTPEEWEAADKWEG